MREVSYLSEIKQTPEKKTLMVPVTEQDRNQRTAITCAALAIMRQHPGKPLVMKTTVKILSDEKAWRESIIAAYFSRIAEFLSMAHEKYTAQYVGSIEERKQMLHEKLKWAYCKIHPDHYCNITVSSDGAFIDVQTFFTLSSRPAGDGEKLRRLTDGELSLYIAWVFGELDDMLTKTE